MNLLHSWIRECQFGQIVCETAAIDMSQAIFTRGRVDDMLEQIHEISLNLKESISMINDQTEVIGDKINRLQHMVSHENIECLIDTFEKDLSSKIQSISDDILEVEQI